MSLPAKPLTFSAVDALGFAAVQGQLDAGPLPAPYAPKRLGPLLEFLTLLEERRLPCSQAGHWLAMNGAAPMIGALQDNRECWMSPDNRRMGFVRAVRRGRDGDTRLTGFLMDAKRAARDVAGLPTTTSGQLSGAMEELENNIHEHSDAADTGLLVFRAARGVFEFVVVDRGIGVLASLQKGAGFHGVSDHGKALEAALADGTSRFGSDSRRGHGFRPIFRGLVNLHGSLRFRSGDHALSMDGTSPTLATAQLAQKPVIDGFFTSVRCEGGDPRSQPL